VRFFFSSRRRHTSSKRDWSSDVCSSDLSFYDYRTEKDAPIVNEFTKLGAEVIVGSHPLSVLDGVDIIVKNPGISYDNIILSAAEIGRASCRERVWRSEGGVVVEQRIEDT